MNWLLEKLRKILS